MRKRVIIILCCIFIFLLLSCSNTRVFRIATTTSLESSGLLDIMIPVFEGENKIKVQYVAAGTGQALRLARDGNVDLVFVHDREAEEDFIRQGFGLRRFEVMKNYFTLAGPPDLEKELKGKDIFFVLKWISEKKLPFISRGDESGTHTREKKLWKLSEISYSGSNYIESGSSMIATLRLASEKGAFTLSDTATFLSHKEELNLITYSEEEPLLVNIYSVIPVNPKKFPSTNISVADKFVEFVTKGTGREIIMNFGKEEFNTPLFRPLSEEESENND